MESITSSSIDKMMNITCIFDNIELIDINFKKCVKGYHLINSASIKENIWEELNAMIFLEVGINIYSKSDGSHLSGMDIHSSLGRISNKSGKYSKTKISFDISSYRLTTVCNDKHCGTPADFIEEIEKRHNFDYYSVIVREENDGFIHYDWLFIPSDYVVLNPSAYVWEPIIGTKKKKKGTQVGWKTNIINGCSMSIRFSMSSQLWIHIEMTEEIKKFIIARTIVENKPKLNYINLIDKLNLV
jgi:hypothetical protein